VGAGGVLAVDADKLHAALAADPDAVADLFAARTQNEQEAFTEVVPGIRVGNTSDPSFRSLGVAEQFTQLVDRYTSAAGGVLSRRATALDTEITGQTNRIADIDQRLSSRRDYLTRQFASLESTLANLQRQQAAVGQISTGR
jgi:flagellar capping protein FliD